MNKLRWDEKKRFFRDEELLAQVIEDDSVFRVRNLGLPSPEFLRKAYGTFEAAKAAVEYAAFD